MATYAASEASSANPWESMPHERDLGAGVGLDEEASSRTSWTPGPRAQADSWESWAPRGLAMLEDLGHTVPSDFAVPPHPLEFVPHVASDVPADFEALDDYLKFRRDYIDQHDYKSSGYRDRQGLFNSYEDLEETATSKEDELFNTYLPVFMTLRPVGDLHCFRHVLVDELNVSFDTIQQLINLTKNNGPEGPLEANRILYHLMKDKGTSHDTWRSRDGPSRWVFQCVQEANDAIRNWRSWEAPQADPTIRPGRPRRSSWDADASSSSARTFSPPRTREVR